MTIKKIRWVASGIPFDGPVWSCIATPSLERAVSAAGIMHRQGCPAIFAARITEHGSGSFGETRFDIVRVFGDADMVDAWMAEHPLYDYSPIVKEAPEPVLSETLDF